MFAQFSITRRPWFLQKVNPNFFYDYAKMFGERSPKDHDNYIERVLNSEDHRLKQSTYSTIVKDELEVELAKFVAFTRQKKLKQSKEQVKKKLKGGY